MSDIIEQAFKPKKGNRLLVEIEFTDDEAMKAFSVLWKLHQSGEDIFQGVKLNAICFHGIDPYDWLENKRLAVIATLGDLASAKIQEGEK